MSRKETDVKERFYRFFEKTDGCWLWRGTCNSWGYGSISSGGRANQKKLSAHRLSYELHKGEIPEGMMVCHSCDVRNCVNPDHLFLGTHEDNMADMANKGRAAVVRGSAKLLTLQVAEIRSSSLPLSYYADKFGVSKSTVSYARNGRTW